MNYKLSAVDTDTMQINRGWMELWFAKFNNDYFEEQLPLPRLELSYSRTRLGSMTYKRRKKLFKIENYSYVIRLSKYYNQTENQYKTVLLHEMIHYYIAYKGITDTAPHGEVFHKMAEEFRRKHGWNITVSTTMSNVDAGYIKEKERYIVAIETQNGKKYLSVVSPRYVNRIDYELKRIPKVKTFGWYKSSDNYFSSFPSVRSIRARLVDGNEFDRKLAEMDRLLLV